MSPLILMFAYVFLRALIYSSNCSFNHCITSLVRCCRHPLSFAFPVIAKTKTGFDMKIDPFVSVPSGQSNPNVHFYKEALAILFAGRFGRAAASSHILSLSHIGKLSLLTRNSGCFPIISRNCCLSR